MKQLAICHVEWQVTDMERAKEFYGSLFGWKFEDMDAGYTLFSFGKDFGGGLELSDTIQSGLSPLVYVEADNIDRLLAKAEVFGGEVVKRATDIPGHGIYAIISDPDGNRIGLYTGT